MPFLANWPGTKQQCDSRSYPAMSETQTGSETRSSEASSGSGKHRGQAAGAEESRERSQGRHRRPPQQSDAE